MNTGYDNEHYFHIKLRSQFASIVHITRTTCASIVTRFVIAVSTKTKNNSSRDYKLNCDTNNITGGLYDDL